MVKSSEEWYEFSSTLFIFLFVKKQFWEIVEVWYGEYHQREVSQRQNVGNKNFCCILDKILRKHISQPYLLMMDKQLLMFSQAGSPSPSLSCVYSHSSKRLLSFSLVTYTRFSGIERKSMKSSLNRIWLAKISSVYSGKAKCGETNSEIEWFSFELSYLEDLCIK